MKVARKTTVLGNLTNGPAKLCQALQVTKEFNGHDLKTPPLELVPPIKNIDPRQIEVSTRIGISKDTHRLWRFYVKDNAFVSSYKH